MLYFIIARHNDARPVIDYFNLKKDMAFCPFPIFLADNVVLCLSGEGSAYAAAASSCLLTRWGRNGLFVHMAPGDFIIPHTITYGGTTIYQEMLYKPPPFVSEGKIEDGEAVHAFLAAGRFLPLRQIIVMRGIPGGPVPPNGPVPPDSPVPDERILLWLEKICFTIISPTSMWRKG